MSDTAHGTEHYPVFITPPGETDTMLIAVMVFLALIALGFGVFYLKLHAIPEKMAHKSNHAQMQLVAILALIALFTHNNIFWVAALLLAAFQLPDYAGMLRSISQSLDRLARRSEGLSPPPDIATADEKAEH